jgi:hypothetical protein
MRLHVALVGCLLVTSCGHAQSSFRNVQFCLHSEKDIPRLKAVVREIAVSNRLEFTDRSTDAEVEAEEIAKTEPHMKVAHPTIILSIDRRDGFGFGGGNFPEAPLQVAFGFTAGRTEAEARKFAESVVQRLSRFWVIHEVPQSRGAFPLKKCDYVALNA